MNNWDLYKYTHGGENTEKYKQEAELYESILTGTITKCTIPSTWSSLRVGVFYGCGGLNNVVIPEGITSIGSGAFSGCTSLTVLIIRTSNVCALGAVSTFNNTPIATGTGYIYVPSALIEDYKTATNWVTFADQFRAIEDYPEITGG